MFIGQTIVAEDNTSGTTVYTPWFPRQSDAMTSVVEVIALASSARLDIAIIHKNSEDTDTPVTDVANFTQISAIGTYNKHASGVEELVRYKIALKHASGAGTVYATLRMLAPSWESTGAQGV